MVLFLTVTLCVSIVALSALLTIKRWEIMSGRIFFSGVRPAAGRYLGAGLHFVERRAPSLLKTLAGTLYRVARRALQLGVVWTVLHAERALERVLQTLRGATRERGEGEASEFLREVAEHKKSLQERSSSKKPNAIYEE